VFRSAFWLTATAAVGWFFFLQDRTAYEVWGLARDLTDSRPAHSVLIMGNSRTFYNRMPYMVRSIADSAHDPEKYQVMLIAWPGASFQELAKDDRVRRIAGAEWDDVVMQGESRGQTTEALEADFETYGEVLASAAHPARGRPWLIVNWTYGPELFNNPDDRPAHTDHVRRSHDWLARRGDMREVHVSEIWEKVRNDHPAIRLTSDGNHPTVAGSYLLALAVYSSISGRSVANVDFSPPGLSPDEAAVIRHIVADMS
jgi:hypothetical protein